MPVAFLPREQCPLCRSSSRAELCDLEFGEAPLADFLQRFYAGRIPPDALTGAHYRVYACRDCGFLYQADVLDDDGMQALYRDWVDQDASLAKKQAAGHKLYRQYAGHLQTLQRLIDKPPAQTRVLDFGMGWGYWVRMAQAHGFDACGFELSSRRREHAASMGVKSLDRLPAEPDFDFIFANQVFEHLPDPIASLQEIAVCLKPGGLLYLRVPDGRGIRQRLQREGWQDDMNAVHPLEHINCFTRASLIRLGAAAGFRPIQAPLRLQWGSLVGGIRREISDRWFSPHVLFTR